jgi:hypothetical protein
LTSEATWVHKYKWSRTIAVDCRTRRLSEASGFGKNTHRRRGSRRDGGSGLRRLAARQVQAREEQLAVLRVARVVGSRHHERSDGAQPSDDRSRVIEPPHMGVASGQKLYWTGYGAHLISRRFDHAVPKLLIAIQVPNPDFGKN